MRFSPFRQEGIDGLAVVNDAGIATGLIEADPNYPGTLEILIQRGIPALCAAAQALSRGATIDLGSVEIPPLLSNPSVLTTPTTRLRAASSSRIIRRYSADSIPA